MLQTHAPPGQALHIVVAENDDADREMICRLLDAEKKFIIEEATNSDGLMTLLSESEVDCVILDRTLGTENVFDINVRLRAKYRDPPALIMLTGSGGEQVAVKAFRCGFSNYLKKKALNGRELGNAVIHAVEHRRAEQQQRIELEHLAKLALRDRLTGLYSREFLEERLAVLVASANRTRKLFAALVIDVNELPKINDSFGHTVGDQALKTFAGRLKRIARASDVFGRLGGDTFLYLIENDVTVETIDLACRRLAEALSFSVELESAGFSLSSSIGAAIYPIDGKTAADLLQAADRAMYLARASGGGYLLASAPEKLRAETRTPGAAAITVDPGDLTPLSGADFTSSIGPIFANGFASTDVMVAAQKRLAESPFASVLTKSTAHHMPPSGTSAGFGTSSSHDVHREENRRLERRHRVLKRGIIVLNEGFSTINCTIRDLSPHGARVTVEDEFAAQDDLLLVIVGTGKRLPAKRRWQRGREIGLKFVS